MQDELDNKTIAVSVQAAKLNGKALKAVISKLLEKRKEAKKEKRELKTGRVSLDELRRGNGDLNSIKLEDKDSHRFERIARKYHVKYTVYKLDKTENGLNQYIIFFKSPEADAMDHAFQEFDRERNNGNFMPQFEQKILKARGLLHKEPTDRAKEKNQSKSPTIPQKKKERVRSREH